MTTGVYTRIEFHKRKISEGKKGKVLSIKHKRSISKALKGKKTYQMTDKIRQKMSESHKGKELSDEHKKKISEGQKGRIGGMLNKKHTKEAKKKIGEAQKGELNKWWKGDNVGYIGLHHWVKKILGKPDTCEHCGANGLSRCKIHWANKSGKYKREKSDWLRLCAKCHKKYDEENNFKLPFNNYSERIIYD